MVDICESDSILILVNLLIFHAIYDAPTFGSVLTAAAFRGDSFITVRLSPILALCVFLLVTEEILPA